MRMLLIAVSLVLTTTACFAESPAEIVRKDIVEPDTTVTSYFTPYDANTVENDVLNMIHQASRSIRMSCYALTDQAIVDELISKYLDGVDVQILMDKTQSFGTHQKQTVWKLQNAGVPLVIGTSPVHGQLLHSKFLVVDHRLTEDGSWNFTGDTASAQSNTINFSSDPARARKFEDFWQRMHDDILNKKSTATAHKKRK